jgi:selenocysteine-specific elongation factor
MPVSAAEGATDRSKIDGLMNTIIKQTDLSERKDDDPFFFMIDHCFSVKGKGTVVTGTVLQGKVKKGDEIELPEIGFKNKIKSMQMFRKDIAEIHRGDRAGILINQLDAHDVDLYDI